MWRPSCQAGFSVNGETRGPKPDVTHPLTGQIEGVAAQRDDFCSAAAESSCRDCSWASASLPSQTMLSFTATTSSCSLTPLDLDGARSPSPITPLDCSSDSPVAGLSVEWMVLPSGSGVSSPPRPLN